MTNFEKIILTAIGVLIAIVLVFGAVVFRQQKAITALTESAAGTSNQAAVQTAAKKNSPPLSEIIKQFAGTIENISGNQLTISTKLTDFSKPKDPEKFKNTDGPANITYNDFAVMEKKIMVNTNEKTVFEKRTLAELKIGDAVSVFLDKSPYSSDTVTAEKITFIELPKE